MPGKGKCSFLTIMLTGLGPDARRPNFWVMVLQTSRVLEASENAQVEQVLDGRTDQKTVDSLVGPVDTQEYRTSYFWQSAIRDFGG